MTAPTMAEAGSEAVRPADFTDEYRNDVCKIGKGAACCRYLAMSAKGWSCEKRGGMRFGIDARAEKMVAKGDNCDGVYEPKPAFRLLKDRFEHKAGTTIYRASGHDYGCANDDARATGFPHTSMTIEPSGDYPFFTVPNADFEPIA